MKKLYNFFDMRTGFRAASAYPPGLENYDADRFKNAAVYKTALWNIFPCPEAFCRFVCFFTGPGSAHNTAPFHSDRHQEGH